MVDEFLSDRDDFSSEDDEELIEDEQEEQIDYCIEVLKHIERADRDGLQFNIKSLSPKVLAALVDRTRNGGTVLHELARFDATQHGFEKSKKKSKVDDKEADDEAKKSAPPGGIKDTKEKYRDLLDVLLQHDRNILTAKDDNQQTAVYLAVKRTNRPVLTLLCDLGHREQYKQSLADSIAAMPKTHTNCIHEAITSKRFNDGARKRRAIQTLIEACDGTAILQGDAEGNTPVHLIMRYENLSYLDKVDKIKSLIELMVTKCPEALTVQNSSKERHTPFQYLLQVCRKAFQEEKMKNARSSAADTRQTDRGLERQEHKTSSSKDAQSNRPALARNNTQPFVLSRRDSDKIPTHSPTSPTGNRSTAEFALGDRALTSRSQHEQNSSRRVDTSRSMTRSSARNELSRIEIAEPTTTRKVVSNNGARLSDSEVKDLYNFIENLLKRVVLQEFPLSIASPALYGRVPVTNKQLHFNLIGTTQPLTASRVVEFYSFLNFENILKFVALPKLISSKPKQSMQSSSQIGLRGPQELPASPTHYRTIFDWLRPSVKQVLQIIVEDDLENPHKDEDIEEAVKNLGVEDWKWRKYDISSGTVQRAAPNVKVLHLYTTGNDAVLQGWLAPDGLRKLTKLKEVVLHVKEPQSERTKHDVSSFKANLTEIIEQEKFEKQIAYETLTNIINRLRTDESQTPNIKISDLLAEIEKEARKKRISGRPQKFEIREEYLEPEDDNYRKSFNSGFGPSDRGQVHRWLEDVNRCRAWMSNVLTHRGFRKIRVALIDDGVDASHGKLKGNIYHGISFCAPHAGSHNVPTSYYASSSGHGTLMASLITFVCPWVDLYVAKMDDYNVKDSGGFTAKSAAQAVEWAVEHDVDVISMSWTIDDDEKKREQLSQLSDALAAAAKKDILMLCAARDEGVESKIPYPAASSTKNIFKIGAASPTGLSSNRVHVKNIDYLVPGTDLREFWHYADLPDLPEFDGSSSATALASGLAALLLTVLARDTSGKWTAKKGTYDKIKRILDSTTDDQYVQPWNLWADNVKEKNVLDEGRKAQMLQELCAKLINRSN